jgi:cell division protein FtsW
MKRGAAWASTVGAWFRTDGFSETLVPRELRRGGLDTWLVAATGLLVIFGMLMVFSATTTLGGGPADHAKRHGFKVLLGIGAFLLGLRIDYHHWGRRAPLYFLGGVALLALVFVPGIGHQANEATRWIRLFGFTLQPSDFARVGLIVYLAYLLSKPRARLERFTSGSLPCLITVGVLGLLLYRQPDLSTTVAFAAIAVLMMVAARIPWRHLALVAIPVGVVAPLKIRSYQLERIRDWVEYWTRGTDLHGGNYQLDQSILAIGSGGLLGRGLGESRQKWDFLPDAHTDFIFGIIGEELGFIGVAALVLLFGLVLWRIYEAARRAPDRFGHLLAVGIGVSISIYAGVNLMVATGLMPTTGLPLPLVSYGGSAILATLFSLGILGNIASQGDSKLLAGIGEYEA